MHFPAQVAVDEHETSQFPLYTSCSEATKHEREAQISPRPPPVPGSIHAVDFVGLGLGSLPGRSCRSSHPHKPKPLVQLSPTPGSARRLTERSPGPRCHAPFAQAQPGATSRRLGVSAFSDFSLAHLTSPTRASTPPRRRSQPRT